MLLDHHCSSLLLSVVFSLHMEFITLYSTLSFFRAGLLTPCARRAHDGLVMTRGQNSRALYRNWQHHPHHSTLATGYTRPRQRGGKRESSVAWSFASCAHTKQGGTDQNQSRLSLSKYLVFLFWSPEHMIVFSDLCSFESINQNKSCTVLVHLVLFLLDQRQNSPVVSRLCYRRGQGPLLSKLVS